jgi:hypothetical protein
LSLLGDLCGEIAGAFFPGTRAIVTRAVDRAVKATVEMGKKVFAAWVQGESTKGSRTPESIRKSLDDKARDLAEEEAYLADKFVRDGRRSTADSDRIQEMAVERESLSGKIAEINAVQSASDIAHAEDLVSVVVSADELASQVGILSTKTCPTCTGIMTLQIGNFSTNVGQKFLWRCTATRERGCPEIHVKPSELAQQASVRHQNPDLDIGPAARDSWKNPTILAKTATRLRSHLGDQDNAIICPTHLLPMKLLPTAGATGLIFDSYQYTCLGVSPDGRACQHVLPVKSFGQVSGLLNRFEGSGIL